jgi:hypothetical protein
MIESAALPQFQGCDPQILVLRGVKSRRELHTTSLLKRLGDSVKSGSDIS